jgi:hypothetical protein
MTAPRYAHLASKALARAEPAPPSAPAAEDRAQTVAAVAREIALRGRRRRLSRGIALCVAAAGIVAAGLGVSRYLVLDAARVAIAPAAPVPAAQVIAHPVGGGSKVVVSGAQGPLDDDRALPAGSRVVTPANGRAMLSFATGTTVMLREGADMTVASEGTSQVLRLDTGSVELHVAKLALDERFLVDTSDSEVEVRGTKFRVSIVPAESGCGAGTRTRVAVTEGVVTVRHDGRVFSVAAGEQWPGGCARPATVLAATPSAVRASAPASAAVQSPSTLAEQNDLFASAFSAKRRGDVRAELATLERFLATYPSSPLAENAALERMRVLRGAAPERASVVAREYLSLYPSGFARAEAEAIVAEAP